MPVPAPPWHPLTTVPLDRPVDLRIERWIYAGSRLTTNHVRGASWITRTSVRHPAPHWSRVPTGWRAVAWAPNTDPAARPVTRNRRGGPPIAQPDHPGAAR
ncbi:hypothetical protein [Methylobacterium sp. WL8]|uniref:hypothetical protein n=1 Tax=Methylobacterium sp. WL8 TaxID=2603899 RepID=UPI0011CB6AF4|nr:hypothetical protein [Methylobacterium sp. WL8]TXN76688.1 hypothetical protein FV234_24475 [Methylobacterium sp. WL8]